MGRAGLLGATGGALAGEICAPVSDAKPGARPARPEMKPGAGRAGVTTAFKAQPVAALA